MYEVFLAQYSNLDGFIDVEKIAIENNIIVEFLPNLRINGIAFKVEKKWYIGINSNLILGKQRFTIAHELAHIINGNFGYSNGLFNKFDIDEKLADEFAMRLLLPEKSFIENAKIYKDSGILSKIFVVEKSLIKKMFSFLRTKNSI